MVHGLMLPVGFIVLQEERLQRNTNPAFLQTTGVFPMNKPIFTMLLITSIFFYEQAIAANPYAQMLPVETPQLSPGKINFTSTPPTTSATLPQPLFIVGDDPLSHKWLTHHEQRLKSLNAIGIIVNVKTEQGLNRFKQYDLTIYPVQGHDFAKLFLLNHYPALINNGKISQ
ncbi:MAG: PFL_4695 family integrating conjugative element protein [Shewanella sp.]